MPTSLISLAGPRGAEPHEHRYGSHAGSSASRESSFSVLLVCTANRCRSPLAEFLLRQAVSDLDIAWQISSAGTHAAPGLAMDPHVSRLLNQRGIAVGPWSTTPVNASMLDAADLVLTATRQHSSYLIGARPELLGKTYPLLRFARRVAQARHTGIHALHPSDPGCYLEAAKKAEAMGHPGVDDLADPVGRPYRRFKSCANTIDMAVDLILGVHSAADQGHAGTRAADRAHRAPGL